MSFQLSLSTEPVTAAYPDDPIIVAPEASVGSVLQLLQMERTGSVLVCDGGELLGIFTERDALKWMAGRTSMDRPVSEAMSPDPVCVHADATVSEAIQKMSRGGYRHLPILDATGAPTGIASVRGILHSIVDHFPDTIYNLPPEPGTIPTEREGA